MKLLDPTKRTDQRDVKKHEEEALKKLNDFFSTLKKEEERLSAILEEKRHSLDEREKKLNIREQALIEEQH